MRFSLTCVLFIIFASTAYAQQAQRVVPLVNGQPVSSGNPLPTSGGGGTSNVNVTQFGGNNVVTGTGAGGNGIPRVTISNDSQIKVWDGTNTAAVKAASTAAAQTDPAAVVRNSDIGTVADASWSGTGNATVIAALKNIALGVANGAGATGSGVPADAIYMGVNVGGNLVGLTPGTAGSAGSQVFSVQGIASMTPLLANPGTAANWGVGATASTLPANSLLGGCQGVNVMPTAVTNGQLASLSCGLEGVLITRSYAPKERSASGTTAAMTGTTSTQLIAAVTSNKIYLTTLTCGNSHATVGTFVNVQDGSGGSTLWTIPAAAVYGGATLNFVPPLSTTNGNGVYVADATTGANVICSGDGYSGL